MFGRDCVLLPVLTYDLQQCGSMIEFPRLHDKIPPNADLVFDIEIVAIMQEVLTLMMHVNEWTRNTVAVNDDLSALISFEIA